MGRCEFCGRAGKGFSWKDVSLPHTFQEIHHFCCRAHLIKWLKWEDRKMRSDPREINAQNASIEAVLFKMREWAEKFPDRALKNLNRGAAAAICKVAIQNYSDCLIKSARGPHDSSRNK